MGGIDIYPPSQPSGMTLAYAEVTANQTGITTEVDLTGLTVTVTVPAGRRIKITTSIYINRTVADGVSVLRIKEGGTQLHQADYFVRNAAEAQTVERSVVITPSAGTHTYKLTLALGTGTGSTGLVAAATFPAYILVEDVTGTIYPAGTLVTSGLIASEPWTLYIPTWASVSGSQPSIGNGQLFMRYIKNGRTVNGIFYFQAGSTTNYGQAATAWTWSLPFTAQGAFVWQPIGMMQCFKDASNCAHSLIRVYGSDGLNNKLHVVFHGAQPVGAESFVGPSVPWTWATSNEIAGYFTYETVS